MSCSGFFTSQMCLLTLFAKIKILAKKNPNLQYDQDVSSSIATMMGMARLHRGILVNKNEDN